MNQNSRPPTIWMNTTSSRNWSRPPVGIIRMEQLIFEKLSKKLGTIQFRECVWIEDKFIAWPPIYEPVPTPAAVPIPPEEPKHILVRLAYLYPRRFAGRVYRGVKRRLIKLLTNSFGIDLSSSTPIEPISLAPPELRLSHLNQGPVSGDVLISIGLDWDYSYYTNFFHLSKHQNIQIVTCCYDLIPVLFPQYCVSDVAQKFQEYLLALAWGSSGVLCISKQTKQDFQDFCQRLGAPSKPALVIKLGDSVPSGEDPLTEEVKRILTAPFILYVSTIERRKNHEVLYRAYHLLARAGHQEELPKLVFVGMQGWGVNELLQDIKLDPFITDLIVHLDHVNDTELNALYSAARFCVYPSLYEGWGLPIGEALAMGKLVISSDQGSLKEVGENLVQYLPPWNANAWADKILHFIQNPDAILVHEQNVKQRYVAQSWSETADQILHFINNLVNARSPEHIVLHPGYDSFSEVGLYAGPAIESKSESGLLCMSRKFALRAGRYQIQLFATAVDLPKGELHINLLAGRKKITLWKKFVNFNLDSFHRQTSLLTAEFNTEIDFDDVQFVCYIMSGNIKLNEIIIRNDAVRSIYNLVAEIWNESLSRPPLRQRLFIDISQLIQLDSRTGIQRVVRNTLLELQNTPPSNYEIVPVYCFIDRGYRLAVDRTVNFLRMDGSSHSSMPLHAKSGDIFLGLDFQPRLIPLHESFYKDLRFIGVKTYFVVYDILILQMPHYFPEAAYPEFIQWMTTVSQSNGLICISETVAAETRTWITQHIPKNAENLYIKWFHLGSNLWNSLSTRKIPNSAQELFCKIKKEPTFLLVGTIEPRKGHKQTLNAFNLLWEEGINANIVIVGKVGWMMNEFVEDLQKHPEMNHRLFFLEGISDEFLEKIYDNAVCLIAASEGEGFGLPLIEAAHHNLALIVRDIPIFREVAGNCAHYFSGLEPAALATAIKEWLVLYKKSIAPSSQNISFLSWGQSVANLVKCIE